MEGQCGQWWRVEVGDGVGEVGEAEVEENDVCGLGEGMVACVEMS